MESNYSPKFDGLTYKEITDRIIKEQEEMIARKYKQLEQLDKQHKQELEQLDKQTTTGERTRTTGEIS